MAFVWSVETFKKWNRNEKKILVVLRIFKQNIIKLILLTNL